MIGETLSSSSTESHTLPDPWSESGYSNWYNVLEVRKAWMRMMGLDDSEITQQCAHSPPTDFDEELSHYNAMFDIQEMNER